MTSDLRAAAERAAKRISEKVGAHSVSITMPFQNWVEEVILAELEPTKPAEPDPNDYVSVPPKIIGKIVGKFVPAEPEEKTTLGKIVAESRGLDWECCSDSVRDGCDRIAAAIEAEVLKRRRDAVEEYKGLAESLGKECDEWEKKFNGAMKLASQHMEARVSEAFENAELVAEIAALKSAAVPTSEEIVQLVREGFMTCSSNTPNFGRHTVAVVFNDLPRAQQLHGMLLGLNAEDAQQIDAACQPPCLDIDGNALSVGDVVESVTTGRTGKITVIGANGRFGWLNYNHPVYDPKDVRKVAAPEKTLVPKERDSFDRCWREYHEYLKEVAKADYATGMPFTWALAKATRDANEIFDETVSPCGNENS